MLPIFALSALSFDASAVVASLAVAAYGLGRMVGSAWGGKIAARLGPSRGAMVALAALAAGASASALAPNVAVFVLTVGAVGIGHASYHVARQAQIHSIIESRHRARALSTLAGVWRVANFVGPIVGAGVIAVAGLAWNYAFAAVMVVAGMVALRAAPRWSMPHTVRPGTVTSIADVVRQSWPILRTLGIAVMLTGGLRAVRLVVIPLWASHVGISDEVTSLIFGASAAIDMVLFYPAGAVMDRFGRKWTTIPSTVALALGTAALPFTSSVASVTAAALVLGIGNGWGSGSLMVLAADVAPPHARETFTGVWMVLQDGGSLVMPLVVSAGAIIALPVGFFAVGGLGLLTSLGLHAWIPPWRLTRDS